MQKKKKKNPFHPTNEKNRLYIYFNILKGRVECYLYTYKIRIPSMIYVISRIIYHISDINHNEKRKIQLDYFKKLLISYLTQISWNKKLFFQNLNNMSYSLYIYFKYTLSDIIEKVFNKIIIKTVCLNSWCIQTKRKLIIKIKQISCRMSARLIHSIYMKCNIHV